MNLYIESIEGGNYIAHVGETEDGTVVKNDFHNCMSFHSLTEIKEKLSGQSFDKVWLKQATPYDEMCGAHDEGEKLMIELEW